MEINKYYKSEYLTCGKTRDNFIIANCPREFIDIARESLSRDDNGVKSCQLNISRREEEGVEKTLQCCANDLQRSFIARDYVCSLFMKETLRGVKEKELFVKSLESGISAILAGDFEKARDFHVGAPFPSDIRMMVRKYGKVELNIFLIDTQNKFIQQAINNFISAREPYSIKLFTTNEKLASYVDQGGTLIECPHDYMTLKPEDFLCQEGEIENY